MSKPALRISQPKFTLLKESNLATGWLCSVCARLKPVVVVIDYEWRSGRYWVCHKCAQAVLAVFEGRGDAE